MARAALVACVLAAAAAVPQSAAAARPGQTALPPTFVLRGFVVQYIPPSGSVVGSLSIRVTSTGDRARALLGELVTVAVDAAMGSKATQLLASRSLLTVTLRAASPGSILKGAGAVRTIVAGGPAQVTPGDGSTSAAGGPNNSRGAAPSGNSGNGNAKSQSQSNDGGNSGDHGSGQSSDGGPGGEGHGSGQSQSSDGGPGGGGHGSGAVQSGSGSSNGHK